MDHLNADQIQALKNALMVERQEILTRGSGPRAAALIDEKPDPGDRQDQAVEEARLRSELTVSGHDRDRLASIDDALGRMERHTYGICEETDEPIPFARLSAEPTTRYTVEALEILEDERSRAHAVGKNNDDVVY